MLQRVMSAARSLFLLSAVLLSATSLATAASQNGAKIPGLPSIVDASGATWTIVSNVVQKNGAIAGNNSNAAVLIYLNGVIYQENTSNLWFRWLGAAWTGQIPDPRIVSANNAVIKTTGELVDQQRNVWSISGGILYRNGLQANGNYNTVEALYESGLIYSENTSAAWYLWTGSIWVAEPSGPVPGRTIETYGAKCDGTTPDNAALNKGLVAAKANAFPLIIDCPLAIHIGSDYTQPIFLYNDTTVAFSGAGKVIVDNVFVPAFVFAGVTAVTLINWDVEYNIPASLPIDGIPSITIAGTTSQVAGAFINTTLTNWLQANMGINFNDTAQNRKYNSSGSGGVNCAAVFYFTGGASHVTIDGLTLAVPTTATADRFIPFGFAFIENYKVDQNITTATKTFDDPAASANFDVPHNLVFHNITLDGMLMGFQGNLYNSSFDTITELRYGDLQDASDSATNVGGYSPSGSSTHWFPPPHLFYLDYTTPPDSNPNYSGDPLLYNRGISISNVADALPAGSRKGIARNGGGNADSLKIGCVTPSGATPCTVSNYRSNRPDGFMDVLLTDGVTLSNITAQFDSSFTYNEYNAAIRWDVSGNPHYSTSPQPTYYFENMTFINVTLSDSPQSSTTVDPIGNFRNTGATGVENSNMTFTNVVVNVPHWTNGNTMPLPGQYGMTTNSEIEFVINGVVETLKP